MRSFSRLRVAAGIETEDRDVAAVARPQAFQDFHRARFAGAVRAEQAEHLAGKDLEVDAFDRLEAAVALGQAADVDGWCGHVAGVLSRS